MENRKSGAVATLNSSLSDADLCRANGWVPGTRLRKVWLEGNWLAWLIGAPVRRELTVRITAIGESRVLAVVDGGSYERRLVLRLADWWEVVPADE